MRNFAALAIVALAAFTGGCAKNAPGPLEAPGFILKGLAQSPLLNLSTELTRREAFQTASVAPPPRCDENDLTMVSCVVYFEGRGQTYAAKERLAEVVVNRMESSDWADTANAVVGEGNCRAGHQFKFMCDGKPDHIADLNAWSVAQFLAQNTLALASAQRSCVHSFLSDDEQDQETLARFKNLMRFQRAGGLTFYCDHDA